MLSAAQLVDKKSIARRPAEMIFVEWLGPRFVLFLLRKRGVAGGCAPSLVISGVHTFRCPCYRSGYRWRTCSDFWSSVALWRTHFPLSLLQKRISVRDVFRFLMFSGLVKDMFRSWSSWSDRSVAAPAWTLKSAGFNGLLGTVPSLLTVAVKNGQKLSLEYGDCEDRHHSNCISRHV